MHPQVLAIDFATVYFVTSLKNFVAVSEYPMSAVSTCAPVRTGQNGVVSIATCYDLDGPGIEHWWDDIYHSRP
jgi:hypothetical protein